MRMTYGMGFNDLMEPAFGFATVNEWVHLAVVTDETGVDGEMNGGRPVMTKMYMNGELKLRPPLIRMLPNRMLLTTAMSRWWHLAA